MPRSQIDESYDSSGSPSEPKLTIAYRGAHLHRETELQPPSRPDDRGIRPFDRLACALTEQVIENVTDVQSLHSTKSAACCRPQRDRSPESRAAPHRRATRPRTRGARSVGDRFRRIFFDECARALRTSVFRAGARRDERAGSPTSPGTNSSRTSAKVRDTMLTRGDHQVGVALASAHLRTKA